jgi:hypothetical protein
MDYFYLFLVAGSILVYLILQFDKQQRRRVNNILKQTRDVEPLLMMQCLNGKINKLNNALITGNAETLTAEQLRKLTTDYNYGRINMQTYNDELSELLRGVNRGELF